MYLVDFPNLETERLFLNEFRLSDAQRLSELLNFQDVSMYTQNIPYPYSLEDANRFINISQNGFLEKKSLSFAIREKESNLLVGGMAIKLKLKHKRGVLGYWIAKDYWGRGLATESLEKVLEFAFNDLNLNKLEAVHVSENLASGKVMRKVGMVKEGEFKQHFYNNNKFWDVVTMGICRDEYLKKNQA